MFGNHGLGCLLEEGAHGKSPKCLCGNLGDFGEFCKGLGLFIELFYLFSIRLPAAREKHWASLRYRQTQPIRKRFHLPKQHATAHY